MSKLSNLAESMIGSEIVKLGNEISTRIKNGEKIYNYTIGDFNPSIFPIPKQMKDLIIDAYEQGFTNYPPADGLLELRQSVADFMEEQQKVKYSVNEVLIASGGRPLIYALFRTVVNPGDKVIYAIPSWNNNHYTYLNGGVPCEIITTPENGFMPTAASIEPLIKDAALLCLCTPQNPTGTTLDHEELLKICKLVIEENNRRKDNGKKLYVLFDQMYFTLTFGDTVHFNPIVVYPEMKNYTISVDGISKAFAATGVRVGWGLGPEKVMIKMKALLSHIGAWAPMAEQKAVAGFLQDKTSVNTFLDNFKKQIEERLWAFYNGIMELKTKGLPVDAIKPQAAIYLTVKFDLINYLPSLKTQKDVTDFLLNEAGLALVPFYCFGADNSTPWYRISVGTCKIEDVQEMFDKLKVALNK